MSGSMGSKTGMSGRAESMGAGSRHKNSVARSRKGTDFTMMDGKGNKINETSD